MSQSSESLNLGTAVILKCEKAFQIEIDHQNSVKKLFYA